MAGIKDYHDQSWNSVIVRWSRFLSLSLFLLRRSLQSERKTWKLHFLDKQAKASLLVNRYKSLGNVINDPGDPFEVIYYE